ncbi:MAG TPA: hypothetical protein VK116_18610, partial [Planctomycetota bacterium]|nr:hypothetical protein [Planctomycetota bacterium]
MSLWPPLRISNAIRGTLLSWPIEIVSSGALVDTRAFIESRTAGRSPPTSTRNGVSMKPSPLDPDVND